MKFLWQSSAAKCEWLLNEDIWSGLKAGLFISNHGAGKMTSVLGSLNISNSPAISFYSPIHGVRAQSQKKKVWKWSIFCNRLLPQQLRGYKNWYKI